MRRDEQHLGAAAFDRVLAALVKAAAGNRLVLASGSPRRRALLRSTGVDFVVVRPRPKVDERRRAGEAPRAYALRLAREKAGAVGGRRPGATVLGADTIVVLGSRVLGKPRDRADARRMLRALSGRSHVVLTALCVRTGRRERTAVVETKVWIAPMTPTQIAAYVATGEPLDKAGAYAIQGRGGAFVERIHGSTSNVVGLPLVETLRLLASARSSARSTKFGRIGGPEAPLEPTDPSGSRSYPGL